LNLQASWTSSSFFVELSSGVKLDVANGVIHQVETRLKPRSPGRPVNP
jgi:hypothetical protein